MSLTSSAFQAVALAFERSLRRPAHRPAEARFIVFVLVAAIGLADYVTGIQVSLTVFYIAVVALAVVRLGWRTGAAAAFGSALVKLVGDVLLLDGARLPLWICWNVLTTLVMCLIMIGVMQTALSLYRGLEQRVAERTAALEEAAQARALLERELLEVRGRERTSVGQELHDDIGQHLVGTALAAKVLAQRLAERGSADAASAQDIVRWIEEGAAKTRQLAHGLLLATIEPAQLGEKLAQLAAAGSTQGARCEFRQEGDPRVANPNVAAQVFRIAQEAMRNALRHGRPRQVDITLSGDARGVTLTVADDGCGLPPPAGRGAGMGLRIMSHRAALVGGTLALAPRAGSGTCVTCQLPAGGAAV